MLYRRYCFAHVCVCVYNASKLLLMTASLMLSMEKKMEVCTHSSTTTYHYSLNTSCTREDTGDFST